MKDKSYCFDFGVANRISIIANQYIYLPNEVLALIGNAKEVNIGIDEKNKEMLINPLDTRLQAPKYEIRKRKIYCKKIIEAISNITESKRFKVTLDRELGGLFVNLGE